MIFRYIWIYLDDIDNCAHSKYTHEIPRVIGNHLCPVVANNLYEAVFVGKSMSQHFLLNLGLMSVVIPFCQVGLYQQYGQPADECDVPFHEQQTAFCPELGLQIIDKFSKDEA